MLLNRPTRSINPNTTKLLCNLSIFSRFSNQSSPNPNNKLPPRKGRQSVRRILNLLSLKTNQNPNLIQTLKTLETSPQSLSSSQASTLITSISNPLISFDFYRFLKSLRPSFQLDSILYTSLMKSQLQSINPQLFKIQFFFNEMKKYKVCLLPHDLHTLFELALPNYVDIAEFFVKEVLEKNEYSLDSYNYLIEVYTKHEMCKEAIFIAERAKARFENLSLEFYACVMNVYVVNRDQKAAMNLFLEMEDKGIVVNEGIYVDLLGIMCRSGSVKVCMVLLEEMRRVGYKPDENLAMDLMKFFMKEGMVSEVEYLFKEGILKCKESLSALVETMVEKGRPVDGLCLVNNLRESGLKVDGHVYASLIRCCGSMGLIEEAEKVFGDVRSWEDVEQRESVYSSMIYAYSKRQMRKKAEMVLNELETKMGFRGSEKVFSCMISMYGELGLFDDVERMFDCWKRSDCALNVDAYVVLVDALSKWGKLDRARNFLLEMRSIGIRPNNSIYSSMMEGYLRLGLINRAAALFDEYKLLGLEVDNLIAGTILSILIQANRYDELRVYLDKMMKNGVSVTRNKGLYLIDMCKNDFCLEKLEKLLQ